MIRDVWAEMIGGLAGVARFHEAATEAAIRACERALGHQLPDQLVALLRESNGVDGEYGLGLVWPAERIAEDNLMFRSNPDFADVYMPFDPLLFFSSRMRVTATSSPSCCEAAGTTCSCGSTRRTQVGGSAPG
jgi:hypothetical protein